MILIIRHAEKPDDPADPNLSPDGYRRAWALANLIPSEFGTPDFLFACRKSRASNRPIETITPLSQVTGVPIDSTFRDKDYAALGQEILSDSKYSDKFLLVCWHHEEIPGLARALGAQDAPSQWPAESFDRIWRLTYDDVGTVTFTDLPQNLSSTATTSDTRRATSAPSGRSPSKPSRINPVRTTGASGNLKVYLLDVGSEQYGDCILCTLGNRTILVDGAHPGDFRGKSGFPSIPAQLEEILGHQPPFHIDLLVATHCHLDHIGCLPDLVAHDLQVEWALVIDERLGFPSFTDGGGDDSAHPAYRLTSALMEEKRADSIGDQDLQQFLQDAANLQSRYTTMLQSLEANGKLVRYGRDKTDDLVAAFADFGLEILGPTPEQLQVCAKSLRDAARTTADQLEGAADVMDLASEAAMYRNVIRKGSAAGDYAEDRVGPGAAKNDQSIVLKLQVGSYKVLLTGDMQLAKPEVSGLDHLMAQLLQKVSDAGPYDFVKLAHHGSYNGFDETVLGLLKVTPAYASSNGTNDATHPDPGVLDLLNENRDRLEWARTDRNGLVTVTFPGPRPTLVPSRGQLNDATPNTGAAKQHAGGDYSLESYHPGRPSVTTTSTDAGEVNATARIGNASLTISLKVPVPPQQPVSSATSVPSPRLPRHQQPANKPVPRLNYDWGLAPGRSLPPLLFVTNTAKLIENIGQQEAMQALDAIRQNGQTVLEVQNPANPAMEVQKQVATGKYQGVILLGGYDVLPAERLDVLDPDLRRALGSDTGSDADNFIVWSDVTYGDIDGDSVPEVPISRIPDAKSSQLVRAALRASVQAAPKRFGERNSARPFAISVYQLLAGRDALLVSGPATPASVGPKAAAGPALYFMLHGDYRDGTRFWGEAGGEIVEAFNLSNLADNCPGVIFTGCCWGALTVQQIASQYHNGQPLAARSVAASIALSFLQAGAVAFIGCTGSHYSPTKSPYAYFGEPLHSAFWKSYIGNNQPAKALYDAKIEYLKNIPHGQDALISRAIELKILRQYTCLGLGW